MNEEVNSNKNRNWRACKKIFLKCWVWEALQIYVSGSVLDTWCTRGLAEVAWLWEDPKDPPSCNWIGKFNYCCALLSLKHNSDNIIISLIVNLKNRLSDEEFSAIILGAQKIEPVILPCSTNQLFFIVLNFSHLSWRSTTPSISYV